MTIRNFSIAFVSLLFLSLVLGGCSGQGDVSEESTEATNNEKTIRDFLQAYNSADAETAISFFADDAVWEDMALGQIFKGKKEITDFFNVAHADFSDLKWELKSIFSANDKAVFESVLSGIHTHSSFPEIPVAGKYIELKAATIVEFRDGKISRIADYYDLPVFE